RLTANRLAIQLEPLLYIRSDADLKGAFETAVRARAAAALRMIDPISTDLRTQTLAFAAEHRLPIIYPFREDVMAGGLASYGTSLRISIGRQPCSYTRFSTARSPPSCRWSSQPSSS